MPGIILSHVVSQRMPRRWIIFKSEKAIQVYLDSSDYSDFSDAKKLEKDDRLGAVLHYLENAIAAGVIQIRFSAIHISEAASLNQDALPLA